SMVYVLDLRPARSGHWQAGDLVDVMPRHRLGVFVRFLAWLGVDPVAFVWVDVLQEPVAQALVRRQLPQMRSLLVGLHAQA
ncbi:hypothetical protein, partial [Pseudomonas syringae group genomosp. 7]|uniref:hypothetical protein n=1 Tax=Pseudomonas syringae group genomosp. 7 TaxID=251699 RepID=UPI00376F4C53